MKAQDLEIRIYIANLAAYNSGILRGEWLDLPATADEISDTLKRVLGDHDEEYAIHDYEAPFAISEYDGIDAINEIAEALTDTTDAARFSYLLDQGYDKNYALDNFDDVTFYSDMTLEDVAAELVDDGCFGTIPDSLKNYIDYEAIARDLSFDSYCETTDGVFHYC